MNTMETEMESQENTRPLRSRRGRIGGRTLSARDTALRRWAELEDLLCTRTAELVSANEQLRREIAERRRLESWLLQMQKLEALGLLGGAIAHDVNSLLTVIVSGAEQVLGTPALDGAARASAAEVQQAARQVAALTERLMAFCGQPGPEPRCLDLNALVADMGRLLRRLLGSSIELELRLAAEPGLVFLKPGLLEQVIMNLAVNARAAMPQGGRLTIETARVPALDAAACARLGIEQRRYVALTVSDTGAGMDAAACARIFEPFFSGGPGGSGLGLAIVHGIVTQSGGQIRVHSAPGRGTTFRIYLPQQAARDSGCLYPPGARGGCDAHSALGGR